ncbi:hypothetical protein [Nocardioides sp. Leaf285]|uniref:hypothetical protein n=1 Tax=Nocardioides sp. Leaf285 TaxID=1736322 RepID=UPI0012EAA573|nr:hypothetical protein [Nocardioides sp. Leaf285]
MATLDDGSEIRMRNLGDRVEIRTWDPTRSCRPPMLDVDHLAGRHVIDVRPARPAEVAGRGEPVEAALARDLCGHCGQGLPHAGTSWREAGACREADAAVDPSGVPCASRPPRAE